MPYSRSWIPWLSLALGVPACGGLPDSKGPAPLASAPVRIGEPVHLEAPPPAEPPPPGGLLVDGDQACLRAHPRVGARRLPSARTSASVALAATGEGTALRVLAYVADGDEAVLHTIDVAQARHLASTPLRGAPEQVLVLDDGRVAVSLRQSSELQILEPTASPELPLEPRCALAVPTEPVALALSPDGQTLALTSAWTPTLSVLDSSSLATRAQIALPREPRAVAFSDDGARAFVAHVVEATLSVVDLSTPSASPRSLDLRLRARPEEGGAQKLRAGCQGFALVSSMDTPRSPDVTPLPAAERPPVTVRPPSAVSAPPPSSVPAPPPASSALRPAGRLFAPFVTVDPGEPTRASTGYGDSRAGLPSEISSVAVIDADAERTFTRVVAGLTSHPHALVDAPGLATERRADCLLPRAAAYAEGALFVACQGNDVLIELDARSVDPSRAERRRWPVGRGPDGIALDTIHRLALVHARFDHRLSLVSLDGAPPREIALPRPARRALTAEQEQGRILFHTAHDPRISSDGRACASCHPDGREDALSWSTPEGPRQTLMLVGRLQDSAPYGWSGASPSVEAHLQHTFSRLGGSGLPDDASRALVAYVASLTPPRPGRPTLAQQRRQPLVERGRALFSSAETACTSCHPAGRADGQRHAVARVARTDRGRELDTPSLRFVGLSAPYFHDGRYRTLDQLLGASDHSMGHALHLDRSDRLALLAYLESL